MPLTQNEIEALLKKAADHKQGKTTTGGVTKTENLPRPVQFGPLRWAEDSKPCASRGCTSPTIVRVRGIPYCTSHALNKLNEIILRELEGVLLDDCNCKAGMYSKGNIHTVDCNLVSITVYESPDLRNELL